jgi:hypothetical protein
VDVRAFILGLDPERLYSAEPIEMIAQDPEENQTREDLL